MLYHTEVDSSDFLKSSKRPQQKIMHPGNKNSGSKETICMQEPYKSTYTCATFLVLKDTCTQYKSRMYIQITFSLIKRLLPCVGRKKKTQPAAGLQKYSLSLNSDAEILESWVCKLLCCEMTSTSPMEQ
ncbi:hypothetical protein ATANTOWER_017711 [Ataeniobius toweri]|uniref:Uncharacterized protein n=1 Tax=Ataeniobius toweri TaxID=208326 RepID=A0ABU7AQP7_9TELE|nr:hypothetical protein [Ataeniobius toweri]